MTYPVYIGGGAAGTMTVTAAGEDHLFEVICHPPEPGLWRVWVQGEGQRLALGLLEGGRLACCGTPEEVYAGGALDRVFGVAVHRTETPHGPQYYCTEKEAH